MLGLSLPSTKGVALTALRGWKVSGTREKPGAVTYALSESASIGCFRPFARGKGRGCSREGNLLCPGPLEQ